MIKYSYSKVIHWLPLELFFVWMFYLWLFSPLSCSLLSHIPILFSFAFCFCRFFMQISGWQLCLTPLTPKSQCELQLVQIKWWQADEKSFISQVGCWQKSINMRKQQRIMSHLAWSKTVATISDSFHTFLFWKRRCLFQDSRVMNKPEKKKQLLLEMLGVFCLAATTNIISSHPQQQHWRNLLHYHYYRSASCNWGHIF